MFSKLVASAILALFALGQGALAMPQTSLYPMKCGAATDPLCPKGEYCCIPGPIPVVGTPRKPGHCTSGACPL